jgi:hypothetical protein
MANPKPIRTMWMVAGGDDVNVNLLDSVCLDFSQPRRAMKAKYGMDFFLATCMKPPSGPALALASVCADGEWIHSQPWMRPGN